MPVGEPMVLVVGGGPYEEPPPVPVGTATVVIGADGGTELIRAADWPVHHVVGDLDSVSADTLAWAEQRGAVVHGYPTAKDRTDLELALELALEFGRDLVVVLSSGGRADHLMVGLAVTAAAALAGAEVTGWIGSTRFALVSGEHRLVAPEGATLTLLALGGPARVTTEGLRYRLDGEELSPFAGRGTSNVVEQAPARVVVEGGVVAVIGPV